MKMRCVKARKNISLALDSRLQQAAMETLQAHLDVCTDCRNWQKDQTLLVEQMTAPRALPQLSPGFHDVLRDKINEPHRRTEFFTFSPSQFRPALLRAAMLLIMIFSALLGYLLGDRPQPPADDPAEIVFNRTMNLDAFADLPAESFGAVYERLLQGDLQ